MARIPEGDGQVVNVLDPGIEARDGDALVEPVREHLVWIDEDAGARPGRNSGEPVDETVRRA